MKTFKEEEAKYAKVTVLEPKTNETSQSLPFSVPNAVKLSKWQELLPQ